MQKERKELAKNQQRKIMGRCKRMKTFVHQPTRLQYIRGLPRTPNNNTTNPHKTKTMRENHHEEVRQVYIISNNILQVSGTLSDDEYSSSMLESSAAYKDSCDPVRLESKPPSSVPAQTHFQFQFQ
jgi:hypothetical protein